jgi:hypothetical protein
VVAAQAAEQPSNGREIPLLPAASCRYLPPVQFLRNGGQRNNASGSKLTDSGSQGLGTRIRNPLACRTTIAPPIARGSQGLRSFAIFVTLREPQRRAAASLLPSLVATASLANFSA